MIWGETHKQRKAREDAARKPHRWFVWHPVRLTDGRYAWLRYVTRQWRNYDDEMMCIRFRGWWVYEVATESRGHVPCQ